MGPLLLLAVRSVCRFFSEDLGFDEDNLAEGEKMVHPMPFGSECEGAGGNGKQGEVGQH